jgi:hypothetical protein
MMKMKRIFHILLVTVPLLAGCKDHPSLDLDSVMDDSCPIEFGIDDELTVDSKVAIDNSNYQESGFVVLGAWKLGSEADHSIFGGNGTEVRYAKGKGWNYSPMCYWKEGLYDFAAVMPSSLLKATHKHTPTIAEGTATISMDATPHKSLTLDFGEGGYDLSAGQHDIMVAYSSADNSDRKMGTVVDGRLKQVSLDFEHQLSLVSIMAATTEPRTDMFIKEIKVFGNSKATKGDIVFTYNGSTIISEYETAGITDKDNFYKTISPSVAEDWKLPAGSEYTTLIDGLLVFPEECTFCIAVTYADRYGKEFTDVGKLSASWEAGKKYTYSFTVSLENIAFAEPTVEPWPETAVEIGDGNIEM